MRIVLRKHPSADRWGEDQKNIIKNILFKLFNNKIPKNIFSKIILNQILINLNKQRD